MDLQPAGRHMPKSYRHMQPAPCPHFSVRSKTRVARTACQIRTAMNHNARWQVRPANNDQLSWQQQSGWPQQGRVQHSRRRWFTLRASAPAAAPAAAAAASASVLSIVPYAIQHGIKFAKVKPVSGSDGERGMQATFDIAAGECLCSVPASSALRLTPGSPPVLGLPGELWSSLPWYARLALLLLTEREAAPGTSKFAGYISVLPRLTDCPALWPAEQLQQLACQYFIQQVQAQQQEWNEIHQQLQPYLAAAGIADSQRQLFHALSIVRSRAFAAPYTAAPLSVAPKLLLAAQVAVGAAWLTQGAAAAGAVEAVGLAAAGSLAAVLLQQSQQSHLQQHALCPLLDMFNHDGGVQSECELDVWNAAFRVVSSRSWRAQQEVSINYGSSSNDALLQLYGFLEPDNPQDRFLVGSLPAALAAAGLCEQCSQAPPELYEVAFTQQGIPAPAAVALEQLCSGRQQQMPGTSGITFYAALSSAARAVCFAACSSELQQLGVDEAADKQLLRVFDQLPSKRGEVAVLQKQVHKLAEACQVLAQQQQQQQQARADGEQQAGLAVPAVAAVADELQQMEQRLAQAQLQLQQASDLALQWQQEVAGVRRLAIVYRLAKHRLLQVCCDNCNR